MQSAHSPDYPNCWVKTPVKKLPVECHIAGIMGGVAVKCQGTGNEWCGQTQFRHHGIRKVLGQTYPPSEPEKLALRRQKAFIVQGGA